MTVSNPKDMQTRNITHIKTYCIFTLIAILLTPNVFIASGLPYIHLSDIMLLAAPFYLAFLGYRIVIDARIFVLILITILVVWSILWGAFLGFNAAFGDLFFLLRMIKFMSSIILASTLVQVMNSSQLALRWFVRTFIKIGLPLDLCFSILRPFSNAKFS